MQRISKRRIYRQHLLCGMFHRTILSYGNTMRSVLDFCCCDKISEKNQILRRKDLFGLIFSEFSVDGFWVPLFWAHGGTKHHGRSL
jgi:hypothetical protein